MLLAIAAFLIAVGAIVGGYAAVTYLPGAMARRRLDRRLRDVSNSVSVEHPRLGEDGTVVRRQHGGPLPSLDKLVAQSHAGSRVARLIQQSGVRTTPSALILSSVAAGVVAAIVAGLAVRQ